MPPRKKKPKARKPCKHFTCTACGQLSCSLSPDCLLRINHGFSCKSC